MNKSHRFTYIHVFSIGIIAIAFLLIARLYIIQVVRGESYSAQLHAQQGGAVRDDNFDRGLIIFQYKDGREFFAAANKRGFLLGINPQRITNTEEVYSTLNQIIELDKEIFLNHASKTNVVHREVLSNVPYEKGQEILNLDIPGVELKLQPWRFNAGNQLAAHVTGFLAEGADGQKSGQYGLERQYDDVLQKDNSNLFSNIFVEFYSGLKNAFTDVEKHGDLIVTIEPNVQTYVEEIAQEIQETYTSSKTGIVIMDPHTGAIIASAQHPTFDLNDRNVSDVSVFNNSVVEDAYEMGSIIKALTIAVGLEEGVITADTTYDDKGSLTLNNRTIYNHDKKVRGITDMQTVLGKSLNTGVAYVVSRVGNKKFADYMYEFFKEKTDIDLPFEAGSLMSNLDSLRDIEVATSSYGQGIAITPIQTIRALASLANGGYIVKPHVVKEIRYTFGTKNMMTQSAPKRIFSQATSEEISRMLTKVVDEELVGGTVSLPNHSIAAKTGTAQLIKPEGGYYEDKYFHSFFGYFPSFDPQFIILLYTVDPRGVSYASGTLTEPFMNLTKYLINYYEIEPDR